MITDSNFNKLQDTYKPGGKGDQPGETDIKTIQPANLALALQLAGRGWFVFPCHESGEKVKKPYTLHGKDDATTDPGIINGWWKRWPGALIGVYCEKSGIFAVDIDAKNGHDGFLTWQKLVDNQEDDGLPDVGPRQYTPSGGAHLIFSLPADLKIPNTAGKLGDGLDLRSNGYICTGGAYEWIPGHGPESPLRAAPGWLLQAIRDISSPRPDSRPITGKTEPRNDSGEYWLNKALARANIGSRNDSGFWLACQLRDSGMSKGEAESVLRSYVGRVPQGAGAIYTEGEALASLREAYSAPPRTPAQSLTRHNGNGHNTAYEPDDYVPALEGMYPPDNWQDVDNMPTQAGGETFEYQPLERVLKALAEQESGDGDLMADIFKGRMVYDHALRGWYMWTGQHWKKDETRAVLRMVSNHLAPQYLHAAAEAKKAEKGDELINGLIKREKALRHKKRAENVLEYACTVPGVALAGDEWDKDPLALAVNNGVIDLRTGQFRAGQPTDYLLSHAPTDWAGIDAKAPRFESFLQEIFGNDADLCAFIQRLFGYGISGLTREHVLPVLWGEGRNGKTTLLETISKLLGESLVASIAVDAIMDLGKSGDAPKPFIHELRGKRLAFASESNEGRRINTGLIKQLTGGDKLNVRTLYGKPVAFDPTHTIMLMTNNKPHVPADDQAAWDRILLIPFTNRFVDNPTAKNEKKRDSNLPATLLTEGPGILAWLVRGFLAWQQYGLNPPAAVKSATEQYKEREDTLGQFISDCCLVDSTAQTKAGQLYESYKAWCNTNQIQSMTGTAFGERMVKRYEKKRTGTGLFYIGIGILQNE